MGWKGPTSPTAVCPIAICNDRYTSPRHLIKGYEGMQWAETAPSGKARLPAHLRRSRSRSAMAALRRERQFRANRGHSLDRVANGSKRDPKAAIGSGKTCREPPLPRFRLRKTRPTRLLARLAENLSESTSRRLPPPNKANDNTFDCAPPCGGSTSSPRARRVPHNEP